VPWSYLTIWLIMLTISMHLVAFFPIAKRSQRKVDFLRDLSHFIVVTKPSTFIITRLSIRLQNLSWWARALVPCW